MKVAKLYGISFTGEEPIIHSDTLYCALLDTLFQYCEKMDKSEKYEQLALSSAFPFIETEKYTKYFIPFSADIFQVVCGKFREKVPKEVKKVRLYDVKVLKDLENFEKYALKKDREFRHVEERTHITIDRKQGTALKGQLFVKKVQIFGKKAGVYFVFPDEFEDDVKETLNVLKEVGIYGDKSVGLGSFSEYKIESDAEELLNHSKAGNYAIMLSLYSPTKYEIEKFNQHKEKIAYRIVQRSGFFETLKPKNYSYEKPVRYYFAEGSVFWFSASEKLRVCGKCLKIDKNFISPKTIALQFEV